MSVPCRLFLSFGVPESIDVYMSTFLSHDLNGDQSSQNSDSQMGYHPIRRDDTEMPKQQKAHTVNL